MAAQEELLKWYELFWTLRHLQPDTPCVAVNPATSVMKTGIEHLQEQCELLTWSRAFANEVLCIQCRLHHSAKSSLLKQSECREAMLGIDRQ
jgi:hypothetical protein